MTFFASRVKGGRGQTGRAEPACSRIREGALNLKCAGFQDPPDSPYFESALRAGILSRRPAPSWMGTSALFWTFFRSLIGEIFGFAHFEAHPDRIKRNDGCQRLRRCF